VKRVGGDDFGVEFFVVGVVEEHGESFARADAKVVTAGRADLQRLFEVFLVERGIALGTLAEDAFGFDDALVRRHNFNFLSLFTEPCHRRKV
jgi:hypothetical protein